MRTFYPPKANPFYRSPAWRRLRAQALERDHYICQDCLARKQRGERLRPRQASVVHHIQPVKERPDRMLDIDNLVSLCDACHNKRHPEKGAAEAKAAPPPGVRIIKV